MPIEAVINIGPVLSAELRAAGIETLEQLIALGYLEATRRLRRVNPHRDCVNSGLALAVAIRDTRWMRIPPAERAALARELRTLP